MKCVLHGLTIIDGTGVDPVPDGVVIIEEGRITAIGPRKDINLPRDADKIIEYDQATIVPGLIDTHVHLVLNMQDDCVTSLAHKSDTDMVLDAACNARRALHAGVTTVRDCGDKNGVTLSLRNAINNRQMEGSRIIASGPPITTTAGHLHSMGRIADSKTEVLKAVRRLVTEGADWIKVMATGGGLTADSNVRRAQYDTETLVTLVNDAHRLDRKVAAHCHGTEGIIHCVEAGTDSIEHCSWMAEDDGIDYDEKTVERIKQKGIYISHTIAGPRTGSPEEVEDIQNSVIGERYVYLRRMLEYGVKMVISSDAGIPGCRFEDFAGSVVIGVKCCGFSPMAAIIAATSLPAKMLGLQAEIGTLEKGKRADILVVKENPLNRIDALRDVVAVFKDGILV